MKKTMIITDSCSDISGFEINNKDIIVVPMTITMNGDEYKDGQTIDKPTFYKKLSEADIFPKTSQPSPQDFAEHFNLAKSQKIDVVVITISNALSGTLQSVNMAKEIVEYDNIYIVDSLSATSGERVLIDVAIKMRDEGKKGLEIYQELETIKNKINVFAMIDTLEYLHKGGRLTKTQARIGELINLKPIVTISNEGRIVVCDKALGKHRANKAIMKLVKNNPINNNYPVYFVYSVDLESCNNLVKQIQQIYPISSDNINITEIGPTIGSHIGPGAFGIIYIGN